MVKIYSDFLIKLHKSIISFNYAISCFIALNTHFESQCIPTPLAWYAHHLPTWFLHFITVATNVIELVVPFLFFFPNRKVRIMAFYLQVCIVWISKMLMIYDMLIFINMINSMFNIILLGVITSLHHCHWEL